MSTRSSRRVRAALAALGAVVMGLGVSAGAASADPTAAASAGGSGLAAAGSPQAGSPQAEAAAQVAAAPLPVFDWKPCRDAPDLRCSRVVVPLDYDRPRGATV
ncbi:MAG: hypothetical protein ACRCY9_19025, partial [Phycicoccus sp.]